MKVIAINGSPNKDGNTYQSLLVAGNEIMASGIDFEIIHVGHKLIHGCIACRKCAQNRDEKCTIKGDDVNDWIQKMKGADGILIGAPVYFSGIPGTFKSFLDRVFFVSGSNGNLFRHKVGAAAVALRRSGGSATIDSLNHYLTYGEMVLATSCYWNIIHGRNPGEIIQDAEGVQIMRVLGRNMAWILKMKNDTVSRIEPPLQEPKLITNFVR